MKIWSRLGIAIAIVAIFGFFAFKALKSSGFLRARQKQVAITLAGAGALLWLAQKAHSKPVEAEGDDAAKYVTPFYATIGYWGVVLMLCGGVLGGTEHALKFASSPQAKKQLGAAKGFFSHLPILTSANARSKSNSAPDLKLQGICYTPNKPSAIVNGHTVVVGDMLGEAKVIAINGGSVVLDVGGETRVLAMK